MPFGEEIANNLGTRSTSSFKYSANEDDVRQKFTGYQQDSETNLDFAEARMYENRHGRFTAVDPLLASGNSANPQTFNRYVYVGNNPINITDPDGLKWYFNAKENRYDWYDKETKSFTYSDEGYEINWDNWERVIGTTVARGNLVYGGEGGFVALDFRSNNFMIFDTEEAAISQAISFARTNSNTRALGKYFGNGRGEAIIELMEWIQPTPGLGKAIGPLIKTVGAFKKAKKATKVVKKSKAITKLCFIAGTPILTADGLKPIEEIREGDKVLSYNEKTKQTEYKTVVQTMVREAKAGRILLVKVAGETEALGVTGEHPFYVRVYGARSNLSSEDDDEGEWVEAKDLQIGDEIRTAKATWSSVENINQRSEGAKVYNFEVADNHNYFVGQSNLLAHNDDCGLTKAGKKAIGNIEKHKDELVRDVQKARGGRASAWNAIDTVEDGIDYSKLTLGEVANAAGQGVKAAKDVLKQVKGAKRLANKRRK